mmetsp:Transcript_108087/g.304464  ORF Transcript_108087/g.304464 Transcript_108087/m.304464 type:complete len:301 (+) Transcript_108087:120-1022(+)
MPLLEFMHLQWIDFLRPAATASSHHGAVVLVPASNEDVKHVSDLLYHPVPPLGHIARRGIGCATAFVALPADTSMNATMIKDAITPPKSGIDFNEHAENPEVFTGRARRTGEGAKPYELDSFMLKLRSFFASAEKDAQRAQRAAEIATARTPSLRIALKGVDDAEHGAYLARKVADLQVDVLRGLQELKKTYGHVFKDIDEAKKQLAIARRSGSPKAMQEFTRFFEESLSEIKKELPRREELPAEADREAAKDEEAKEEADWAYRLFHAHKSPMGYQPQNSGDVGTGTKTNHIPIGASAA